MENGIDPVEENLIKQEEELVRDLKDIIPSLLVTSLVGESWGKKIGQEFTKDYMIKLGEFIAKERVHKTIVPAKDAVFNLFKLCKFEDVKICIIVDEVFDTSSVITSKELNDMFITVEHAIYDGFKLDLDVTLNSWYQQGIFVLPRVMTTVVNKPGSHVNKGWEEFTNTIIKLFKQNNVFVIEDFTADNIKNAHEFVKNKYNIELKW